MGQRLGIKLDPSKALPFANGIGLTTPQRLAAISLGLPGISHSRFDPVFVKFFRNLPNETQKILWSNHLSTTTFLARPGGEAFGESLVWADGKCSVTLVIDKVFRGNGGGLVADLTGKNLKVISFDGKSITIEILRRAIRHIDIAEPMNWGRAGNSSLLVPVRKSSEADQLSHERFLNVPPHAVASLICRGSYLIYGANKYIFTSFTPSCRIGMLAEGPVTANLRTKLGSFSMLLQGLAEQGHKFNAGLDSGVNDLFLSVAGLLGNK